MFSATALKDWRTGVALASDVTSYGSLIRAKGSEPFFHGLPARSSIGCARTKRTTRPKPPSLRCLAVVLEASSPRFPPLPPESAMHGWSPIANSVQQRSDLKMSVCPP